MIPALLHYVFSRDSAKPECMLKMKAFADLVLMVQNFVSGRRSVKLIAPPPTLLLGCVLVGLICGHSVLTAAHATPDEKKIKNGACKSGDPKCNGDYSKPFGSHLPAILDTVQATPEQRTNITAIVESFRPKIDPLRQSYQQKKQEFLIGLTTGLAAEQLMGKQNDLSQLSSDISCQYCQMSLEVRKQLKPNQIVLYEEYRMKQGWNRRPAAQPAPTNSN